MIEQQTIEPVRHGLSVPLEPAAAFRLFTDGFDSWWPREHHIGEEDMAKAIIEPHEGGRCHEIGVNGTECSWGTVLTWDPPGRLVVAWQLNGQWQFDPDISHASEYEVTFSASSDGGTDVLLEHRNSERHGDGGADIQAAVGGPDGWPALLELYEKTA